MCVKARDHAEGIHISDRRSLVVELELTSPILTFDSSGKWREDIRKAFRSVEDIADIHINFSCGTHVHISPGDGRNWTLAELKEIYNAAIHFEDAFRQLVPPSRRDNFSCKSNAQNQHSSLRGNTSRSR